MGVVKRLSSQSEAMLLNIGSIQCVVNVMCILNVTMFIYETDTVVILLHDWHANLERMAQNGNSIS